MRAYAQSLLSSATLICVLYCIFRGNGAMTCQSNMPDEMLARPITQ